MPHSAAGAAGTIYTLSTLSGCRLEDVKAATTGNAWYQLYLVGGRDIAMGSINRAKAAGYKALVVTIDTPVAGLRERDSRNGVKELLARNLSTVPYLGQMLARPSWLISYFNDGGLMNFPNIVIGGDGRWATPTSAPRSNNRWSRGTISAGSATPGAGPIVVKGVHTADDARRAVGKAPKRSWCRTTAAGSSMAWRRRIRVLPEVVAAVKGQTEILLDGGIRRGSDVVKALCMGARAVLIGRAYAYGLAAAGEEGVARAIEILRSDIVRTMKLLGCASVADLDGSYVDVPAEWTARLPR